MRYHKYGVYQDGTGRRIFEGTCTVYLAGTTTLATVYDAETGGSVITDSVITTDNTGFFEFWIDDSDYASSQKFKLILTKNGYSTYTLDNMEISRPGYTTSDGNTIMGYLSGTLITTGYANTLIGRYAGYNLVDATNNVVIGYNAGVELTNDSTCVLVGASAGQYMKTGTVNAYNTYIGGWAGQGASGTNTGVQNAAGGFLAMGVVTTGSYNAVWGSDGFKALTEGLYNSGVGDNVANALTTGDDNSFLGFEAGSASGLELTTADHCLFLGFRAGYGAVGAAGQYPYAIAIGSNTKVSQKNSCVIGSTVPYQGRNTYMGLGTETPETMLHLKDTAGTDWIPAYLTDGLAAAITLEPTYTSAGADTVTRHNYISLKNPQISGSVVAVTDAAVFMFDDTAANHKALEDTSGGVACVFTANSGPTGASTNIQGWTKINVNGTIRYIPFW